MINNQASPEISQSKKCPKCESESIASLRLLVNSKNGVKIAESDTNNSVVLICLIGGILLMAFGLVLLVAVIIEWGNLPMNPFFAIAAIVLLFSSGVKAFNYSMKLRKIKKQKNDYKRILQYSCSTCQHVWEEDVNTVD